MQEYNFDFCRTCYENPNSLLDSVSLGVCRIIIYHQTNMFYKAGSRHERSIKLLGHSTGILAEANTGICLCKWILSFSLSKTVESWWIYQYDCFVERRYTTQWVIRSHHAMKSSHCIWPINIKSFFYITSMMHSL